MKPDVKVFLQARMSSQRLPGKVLENLGGSPLLMRVYENVKEVFSAKDILFLTSNHVSDDPLSSYLENNKLPFFRGSLENVLERFAEALKTNPCTWVMRISCDSPVISPANIQLVLNACEEGYDLITNTFPRSFPKGQSIEIIHRSTLQKLQETVSRADHQEHVTKYIYDNSKDFKIRNVTNPKGDQSMLSDAVDTPEELQAMRERFQKR